MVSFTKLIAAGLVASTAVAAPHAHQHSHVHVTKRSSNKRGAAYNDVSTVHSLSSSGAISWAYDWNMVSSGTLPSNVEFVPMLWGSKMFGEWFTTIQTLLGSGCNYIMGFNEPDQSSQAAMTPSEAAQSYAKYITPYSGKAKLVTPAVTNGGGNDVGLGWMRQFLDACSDCGMSVLAVHWYGASADEFKTFVQEAQELASQYNLQETWVTEFALSSAMTAGSGTQESTDFLNEVIPWLDSQSGIGRYAYYMCADGFLLEGSDLSASGKAYTYQS
ncbi:hypothetical protein BDV32DRAFT_118714 [Aspergillus pseudonomiae]|uniref:Asl1-like glycosyl hydrolase catalytic domain-containing protein n=2 Tax=Aspergillus subgen. Circumdati TaxID=2720871 RepID=A0A0L1IL40_ASPN3|nr:uncharacterized protein ANOM_011836 [Aspergillus nomiae NRRL 13137]XP_031940326.1 uncharacterized protein BDV37DRAFT_251324 [Aspergillus pseudonomiae]KAB8263969.1 hypothetical protein BDV32DRAFT_118714 [Aspergillus pseudonomiae]KAE8403007.1 hypothetical protein BDV37DRAFT_251324 [Aspergillus pseudonomiae]KNG80316.1 hypothetical protein ANOM_011836 [Aspergillus nomiae NRRL 13137]